MCTIASVLKILLIAKKHLKFYGSWRVFQVLQMTHSRLFAVSEIAILKSHTVSGKMKPYVDIHFVLHTTFPLLLIVIIDLVC